MDNNCGYPELGGLFALAFHKNDALGLILCCVVAAIYIIVYELWNYNVNFNSPIVNARTQK